MQPHNTNLQLFQTYLLDWYTKHGRNNLPWRQTYHPYHVLVSELMLQQTQVNRVIPKFEQFISLFPDYQSLAKASTAQLIQAWQGLGYNRRVLFLQKTAQKIMADYQGRMPTTQQALLSLPGIGPYTCSAILAFAYKQPVLVLETNIRAVYIYHFFSDTNQINNANQPAHTSIKITDEQITPLLKQSLYTQNPRLWYSALMDYGAYLKRVVTNPTRKSSTHAKQSKFEGSFRQLRGYILRELANQSTKKQQTQYLIQAAPRHFNQDDVQLALEKLELEGFIEPNHNRSSYKLID